MKHASTRNQHVILLHGIWMRGITLQLLARRVRAAGYSLGAANIRDDEAIARGRCACAAMNASAPGTGAKPSAKCARARTRC